MQNLLELVGSNTIESEPKPKNRTFRSTPTFHLINDGWNWTDFVTAPASHKLRVGWAEEEGLNIDKGEKS